MNHLKEIVVGLQSTYKIRPHRFIGTGDKYASEINQVDVLDDRLLISGITFRGSLSESTGGIGEIDLGEGTHYRQVLEEKILPTASCYFDENGEHILYAVGKDYTVIYVKNIESGEVNEFYRFENSNPMLISTLIASGPRVFAVDFINHSIFQFSNGGKLLFMETLPMGFDFPIDFDLTRDGKLVILLWRGYRNVQSKYSQYAREPQGAPPEFLIVLDPKSREFTPLGLTVDLKGDFPKKMSLDDSGNIYVISRKFLWKFRIKKGIEMIFRGNPAGMVESLLPPEAVKSSEINFMPGDIAFSRGRLLVSENNVNPGIYIFEVSS